MDALHYKIRMDKYYRDVEVDPESVLCLPDHPIDVSSKLHYINSDVADSEDIDEDHMHTLIDLELFDSKLILHPLQLECQMRKER